MSPVIKRKGEKFTLPGKYLLFILTILCAGLMILTFSTNAIDKPINAVAGYIIIPFQNGISQAGKWISNRSGELAQIRDLLDENARLKEQINELTIENTKLQQDKYELNNLRNLYKIDSQYEDYKKVGARIISRDSGNWYHSFILDKGSDDGISENMNVIADGGLVGIIVSVGPNWSKVKSLIADNSNVSGTVLATGDNIIVSGNLQAMERGVITFSQLVDSNSKVEEGDKVVTSDISSLFLPDILIGYMEDINVDANNITKSGYITPAVDFEHLSEVLIILELKQTVEED